MHILILCSTGAMGMVLVKLLFQKNNVNLQATTRSKKTMTVMKEKIMDKKIQVIRGLAIAAVVAIHSNAGGVYAVLDRPFVNFSVAIFIFLSGYLTNIDVMDIKEFYKKRIVRVAIPYVIWSVIYVVATKNWDNVLKLLLTAKATVPLYFIFVYIQMVLITPLISRLVHSRLSWIGWCISPLTIVVVRYILPINGIELGFPFPGTIFLPWLIYYYLGILLGNRIIDIRQSFKKTLLWYIIAIILAEAEGLIWYKYGNFDMATTQLKISSMAVAITAILMAYIYINSTNEADSLIEKALNGLGDASFGIYLSHILIIMVLNRLFGRFPFPILTILTIVISYICVCRKSNSRQEWCKIFGVVIIKQI